MYFYEKKNGAGGNRSFEYRSLANIFFEASTRTSCSLQAAMMRLGGKIEHIDGKRNNLGAKKGESLEGTIKCFECYSHVTILKHPALGSLPKVLNIATKPIINVGDSISAHPSPYKKYIPIYNPLSLIVMSCT